MTRSVSFLRRILLVDAATCVASGLLMTVLGAPLAGLLGLPHALLLGAGLALFPIAAFIAFVGARATESSAAVALVVVGNLAWALACLWVVAGGELSPSAWGTGFVAVQALTVLGLSVLEARAARALRAEPAQHVRA